MIFMMILRRQIMTHKIGTYFQSQIFRLREHGELYLSELF